MYSTPLCQACFFSMVSTEKKADTHWYNFKSHVCSCTCSYTYGRPTLVLSLCFSCFFLSGKFLKHNRFHISFVVQQWHAGPSYAVQRWLCFPSRQGSAVHAAVLLCGWYHFQFIKPRFVWEGLQIKVPDFVFFTLLPPSVSVYLSLLLHCRVLQRAWLCLWSFNIQPGSSVLTAVCVFVFRWSPLLCQRNSAQLSSFNSLAPHQRSLLKQAEAALVYWPTIHNRLNKLSDSVNKCSTFSYNFWLNYVFVFLFHSPVFLQYI